MSCLFTVLYIEVGYGNDYASIVGCEKSVTEATIPSEISDIIVTAIEDYAFYGCSSLINVTIPSSITHIGKNAFSHCSSLTSVTIPNGVTSIGDGAFNRCSNLTSITIPNSITSIGEFAFDECSSLTDVYYGGSASQWKQITIEEDNKELTSANIHYNTSSSINTPSTPTAPTQTMPVQAANAVLSPQKLAVDGKNVDCEKYNIGGNNYFKLRDLAYVLNGTASQFEVGFDTATSTVSITTGTAYTPNGTELVTGIDNSSTAQPSNQTIIINGVERSDLTVYNIGGSNFFQLRELGNALGFDVDFDATSNTATVSSTQN